MNKYAIKLIDRKQSCYRPNYALSLVKLKTIKTYIEIYLKTRFIQPSKFLASALILFNKKTDGNFYLCVDYQSLNNLTIKNQYPLSLIGKVLDKLDHTKRFIQLNLISTYHKIRIREGDKQKTVFQTRYSYFKYQIIFFGFFNMPDNFQDYINKILIEKFDDFVILYLDNILIYIKDLGQPYIGVIC